MASTSKTSPAQGASKGRASTTNGPRLTPFQRDMLRALLSGSFEPHPNEKKRAQSLVSRGFAVWEKNRVRITEAGQAALAKADGGAR